MTRIIGIDTINVFSRQFSRSKFDMVRDAVRKSGGRVVGVVHPLFCKPLLGTPEKIIALPSFHLYLPQVFSIYQGRLEAYLKRKSWPVLVFVPKKTRIEIETWLKGLSITGPVVTIPTRDWSTNPVFASRTSNLESIGRLYGILTGALGVYEMNLVGEKFWRIKNGNGYENKGCVSDVADMASLWGIRPYFIEEALFPDIDVD